MSVQETSREIIARRMDYCKFFSIGLVPNPSNGRVRHAPPRGWDEEGCSAHKNKPPAKGAYGVLQPINGLTVDCDSEEAIDWLEEILDNNDVKTLIIKTARGYRHYPFLLTDEQVAKINDTTIYSKQNHPIPKVDMRGGSKSYIVGAGSVGYNKDNNFEETVYEVEEDREVAFMPDELFDLINTPNDPVSLGKALDKHEVPKQQVVVDDSLWGEGERNDSLSRIVYKYVVATELSDEEVLRIALKINKEKGNPPLADKEVLEMVSSKIKKFRAGLPKRDCIEVPYSSSWSTQARLCYDRLGYRFVWDEYTGAVSMVANEDAPPWERYEPVNERLEAHIDATVNSKCRTIRYTPNKGDTVAPPAISFYHTTSTRRAIAHENPVYPPKEWFESLPVNNNHDWVHNIFYDLYPDIDHGIFPEEYVVWVARNTLASIGKRILKPGCVHVESLVLKGSAGCGKSAFAASLMPTRDWFSDSLDLSQTAKEIEESTTGAIVVECPEMIGRRNRSNAIKAFNTASSSRFRRAYGRQTEEFKRKYIVVYTSNADYPLPDDDDLMTLRRYAMLDVRGTRASGDKVADKIEENRVNIFGAVRSILASDLPIGLPDGLKKIHEDIVKNYAEIDRGLETIIEHAVHRLGMQNPKRSDFCRTEIMTIINEHRRANNKWTENNVLQILRDSYEPVLPTRRKAGVEGYRRDARVNFKWDDGEARDYAFKFPFNRNNPDMFTSGVSRTRKEILEDWDGPAEVDSNDVPF